MSYDLSHLTYLQFAILALTVALVDFAVSTLAAIIPPNYFSWSAVARVLETHVLKRVIPITGLALLSATLPAGIEHDATYLAATGALALYVGETIKSIVTSYQVAKAVAADEPQAVAPLSSGPVPAEDPLTSGLSFAPPPADAVPPDAPEEVLP